MLHLCRNEDYRSVSDNTECERERGHILAKFDNV